MLIKFDIPTKPPKYAVYRHLIDGQTLYVGCCLFVDVLRAPDAHRNDRWREIAPRYPSLTVEVLSTHQNEADAIASQAFNVILHNAYCNLNGKTVSTADSRSSAIKCENDGNVYPSIAAAGKAYGIAATTISNHLNQRSGYKTVRGMTFKRI